jgi:hypothetical protein
MRACPDEGELAVAVGQRLRRPGQPVPGPGGVAERPVWADGDSFAAGVNFACSFPVLAHRGVVQPRVMRSHGRGVMIEDLADDFLRDVPVDQAGSQRVPPLMRGQVDRVAVLVADVAAGQPGVERPPVCPGVHRLASVAVRLGLGKQYGRGRVLALRACLLAADVLCELLIDGHECLAVHLVVEVAQIGCPAAVAGQAVERQPGRVAYPQPAADEDESHQAVGRVVPQAEVGRVLHLGHHLLGDCAGQLLRTGAGIVLGVERGGGGQGVVPAVAADRAEERVQRADVLGVVGAAGQFVLQDRQVALEQFPVDLPRPGDLDLRRGQELPEAGDRADALVDGVGPAAARGPPPGPPLGQCLQPRLRDLAEADRGLLTGNSESAQPPQVTRVLGFPPAAPLVQVLNLPAGRDQQRSRVIPPAGQPPRPL